MGARVLLYVVPGLPLHVEDLMPQALPARCAGVLRAHGHHVLIADDGTVDAIDNVTDGSTQDQLTGLLTGAHPGKRPWASLLSGRRGQHHRALEVTRDLRIERAMDDQSIGSTPPQLAVLFAHRRKDLRDGLPLATALKRRWPDCCVAIAGEMARCFGRQILARCDAVDAICGSTPEATIAGLAVHWNNRSAWHQIPGLLSRTAEQTLAETPSATTMPTHAPPIYHPDVYPALLDGGKFRLFTLRQSTGYAHLGHYRGGQRPVFLSRSVPQLRSEMLALHELYGTRTFHIEGEHTPEKAINDLAGACKGLPFPVLYSRDTHVFEIRPKTVAHLSASGCQALRFSLLTGSQMTLTDFFGENWTISHVERCLRLCRDAGLFVHGDFIHPVPVDDYHTRAETIRLLHRCRPDSLRLHLPQLIPGSAWHQHAAEFEFLVDARRLGNWTDASGHELSRAEEAAVYPHRYGGPQRTSVLQRLQAFDEELEHFPAPIESGCQTGLLARVSGQSGAEQTYIQGLEQATKTLDIAAMRDYVDTYNIHATATINTLDFHRTAAKKVVGN